MDVYLEKVDPEHNCFRFYSIRIEPDLFADQALVVHWGRIGKRGRTRVRGSGSASDCRDYGTRILNLRLRHGYVRVEDRGMTNDGETGG